MLVFHVRPFNQVLRGAHSEHIPTWSSHSSSTSEAARLLLLLRVIGASGAHSYRARSVAEDDQAALPSPHLAAPPHPAMMLSP